ncbi:hypothetical protein PHYPSEUDO_013657 [Phytophthora pseudosyringae]|uniref:Uncharacterized protein n=1 Tax=Phytophthora pseudosyringae TaxID=221518 RepID=A0A8T1V7V3_9STRA|nr:hypothetical protein PHYPSEUDO_013657 [Phytophthora pseudosyringae]
MPLDEQDHEDVKTLAYPRVSSTHIARFLNNRIGCKVTPQQARNLIRSITGESSGGGGLKNMLHALRQRRSCSPRSDQMDFTHGTDNLGYHLEDVEFRRNEWSSSDLQVVEQTTWSQVFGQGGEAASNWVSILQEGVTSDESHPVGNKVCRWIDPKTGVPTLISSRGVLPVPQSVGSSFCRIPTSNPPSRTTAKSHESVQDVQELYNPFMDDDDSPLDGVQRDNGVERSTNTAACGTKRTHNATAAEDADSTSQAKRQCYRYALNEEASILARLSDDPDLLERFLSIRQGGQDQGAARGTTWGRYCYAYQSEETGFRIKRQADVEIRVCTVRGTSART